MLPSPLTRPFSQGPGAQRPLRIFSSLAVALACLFLFVFFLKQFLGSGITTGTERIPGTQLSHSNANVYAWSIPSQFRAKKWQNTPVRILEDGQPMPFRVEDAKSVDGPGKFRVQDDTVWFWPMSGGTGAHEWIFGWTKQKPVIGFAVAAGACLILGLVLGGTGIWSFLTSGATSLGDVDRDAFREQIVRRLAVGCFIGAVLAVLQSWQPLSLKGAFVLQPDLVFREAGDDFYYRLPHWI